MSDDGIDRPPLAVRVLHGTGRTPDWSTMTYDELLAYRDTENRKRGSRPARLITGFPDRGATIEWQVLRLPDRRLTVRVYQPRPGPGGAAGRDPLPLVLHLHGGGFVGTAVQCDWVSSHLAAQLPAVVVSVEHRLLDQRTPLAAALDDGWDGLQHAIREGGSRWGTDRDRVALVGESTGGQITTLMAIRAREEGLPLRAQVLVNPVTDLTPAGFEVPSMKEHAQSPPGMEQQLRLLRRLAAPTGTDPRTVSPMHADDLSGLAPALVLVPTVDPLADHGRGYAERLRAAGTRAHLIEFRGAPHAFLSMPGLLRDARTARAEILHFLHGALRSRWTAHAHQALTADPAARETSTGILPLADHETRRSEDRDGDDLRSR